MEKAQLQALTDSLGGPMTESQIRFLRDVQGFIEYCIANQLNFLLALSTLAHDVNGKLSYQDAPWFSPKVTGYAKSMGQMAAMANDPEIAESAEE